jgi:hypothetical protein
METTEWSRSARRIFSRSPIQGNNLKVKSKCFCQFDCLCLIRWSDRDTSSVTELLLLQWSGSSTLHQRINLGSFGPFSQLLGVSYCSYYELSELR